MILKKNTIKKFRYLGYLFAFGIPIIISACSKEENRNNNNNAQDARIFEREAGHFSFGRLVKKIAHAAHGITNVATKAIKDIDKNPILHTLASEGLETLGCPPGTLDQIDDKIQEVDNITGKAGKFITKENLHNKITQGIEIINSSITNLESHPFFATKKTEEVILKYCSAIKAFNIRRNKYKLQHEIIIFNNLVKAINNYNSILKALEEEDQKNTHSLDIKLLAHAALDPDYHIDHKENKTIIKNIQHKIINHGKKIIDTSLPHKINNTVHKHITKRQNKILQPKLKQMSRLTALIMNQIKDNESRFEGMSQHVKLEETKRKKQRDFQYDKEILQHDIADEKELNKSKKDITNAVIENIRQKRADRHLDKVGDQDINDLKKKVKGIISQHEHKVINIAHNEDSSQDKINQMHEEGTKMVAKIKKAIISKKEDIKNEIHNDENTKEKVMQKFNEQVHKEIRTQNQNEGEERIRAQIAKVREDLPDTQHKHEDNDFGHSFDENDPHEYSDQNKSVPEMIDEAKQKVHEKVKERNKKVEETNNGPLEDDNETENDFTNL